MATMNNWTGTEPIDYSDDEDTFNAFALAVIVAVTVVLVVWGVLAAGGPN